MGKHRRFADNAGYTRHCWECVHATVWEGELSCCDAHDGRPVTRYDSPNNGCSVARGCIDYEEGR